MAGRLYNVATAATKGGAATYTFPDGFRIREPEWTLKEDIIDIPFAAGGKDLGDGMLASGTLTVAGPMYAANGPALDALIATMRSTLQGFAAGFYVYHAWVSGTRYYHAVNRARTVRWSYTEGWGGRRADVEVTFSVTAPEFATA